MDLYLVCLAKMPYCSALNCRNKGVHVFPKDPKRRKKWENALRIKNFKAKKTDRLCAAHFKEDDYFGKSNYTDYEPLAKFLKKTAVPSIFFFTKSKSDTPAALKRQYRLEKRNQRKLFQAKESQSQLKLDPSNSKDNIIEPVIDLTPVKEEICISIVKEEEICMDPEDLVPAPIINNFSGCSSKSTQVENFIKVHSLPTSHYYKPENNA